MPSPFHCRSRLVWGLLLPVVALCSRFAGGSTVVPMNAARMSDYAAQVIVADIGESTSAWADHPRRIETTVELHNIDYLKGGYDGAPKQRTLIVPGGKVGTMQMQMRIGGAPEFKMGERWVLFLLSGYKTFPTVGLAQGSFRIVADEAGVARVYQGGGLPVVGVNEDTWIEYAGEAAAHSHVQPVGATPTVRVNHHGKASATRAMTFDAFKAAIQPILDKSKDHKLTRPAGRRIPVVLHPVPIRRAAGSVSESNATSAARGGVAPAEAPTRGERGSSTFGATAKSTKGQAKVAKPTEPAKLTPSSDQEGER